MGRVEVPVKTQLRFVDQATTPVLAETWTPASVIIEFAGREIGWVMPRSADAYEPGPTVTARLDSDVAWQDDA
jgi:hypothetical protein